MTRIFKVVALLALALLLLLGLVAFALHRWVSTDDFRARMEHEATAALGVPVKLGSIAVDVWPLPAVALGGLTVQTRPAFTLERLEVRPEWHALLLGRLAVATLLVHQAVVPQQGVDALMLSLQKKKQPAPTGKEASLNWLPRRTVLDDVTWVSGAGTRTTFDAQAQLGDDGLPDTATITLRKGALQGMQGQLKRESQDDGSSTGSDKGIEKGNQWRLRIDVGGGTVQGQLGTRRVAPARAGQGGHDVVLQGQLQTKGVEVAALTAPNKPLSGLLEASTTLSGRAATLSALADVLQTHTTFTVRNATLHGLDLVKAVQTIGLNRGGQTGLDTLAGQVHSQGRAVQLNNLVASSGALSANGNVAVSPAKALSGRVTVDLAGGAVGVPLLVGGTLDAPEVTLTRGALLGAAIGTAIMPGVGTGAGAKLGDRMGEGLGKLFGK
ncbi:hypothetical protein [Polaromonas sp.]|uniref:hypothetical protein n=1 Tax=Polaromonas sp. TaxID=1869339 RepID=UPI002FC8A963